MGRVALTSCKPLKGGTMFQFCCNKTGKPWYPLQMFTIEKDNFVLGPDTFHRSIRLPITSKSGVVNFVAVIYT